jgi:catechol 2,3-dioxygenase-like lactoylglutathione lyase family enzyme
VSLLATRLDHVAITVADLERSIAFYTEMLGCAVAGQLLLDDGDFKIVYLRSGDAVVELFAFRGSEADGNLLEIVSGFPDVEPYRPGWE